MANSRLDPFTNPNQTARPPGMPGWVKWSLVVVVVVAVIVAAVMLIGGGEHGPGRHTPSQHGSAAADLTSRGAIASTSPLGLRP